MPVHLAKRDLGELGRHPQEPGHDHPQGGPRPSHADGDRHAGDVAQAHGGGEGRGQRLEVAHLANRLGIVVLATDQFDRMAKHANVHEAHPQREVDRSDQEPEHHDRHPDNRHLPEEDGRQRGNKIGTKELIGPLLERQLQQARRCHLITGCRERSDRGSDQHRHASRAEEAVCPRHSFHPSGRNCLSCRTGASGKRGIGRRPGPLPHKSPGREPGDREPGDCEPERHPPRTAHAGRSQRCVCMAEPGYASRHSPPARAWGLLCGTHQAALHGNAQAT